MTVDRVTVSIPEGLRRATARIAEERGVPYSAVVTEALTAWLRGRLVESWLIDHQGGPG